MFKWNGTMEINGVKVSSFEPSKYDGAISISLKPKATISEVKDSEEYVITVKRYMTKPATPEFDFMAKWNNNTPMPLRTMVGTVVKETKGMVYMKLRGELLSTLTPCCLKCGKPITNPVSQYFGMGPECGNHNYTNPFDSEEELRKVAESYRKEYLNNLTWEGWVIKSAIEKKEIA